MNSLFTTGTSCRLYSAYSILSVCGKTRKSHPPLAMSPPAVRHPKPCLHALRRRFTLLVLTPFVLLEALGAAASPAEAIASSKYCSF
eukprot:COSAG02_NODE_7586_length_2947_cov_2.376404_1_plen_87_part_00